MFRLRLAVALGLALGVLLVVTAFAVDAPAATPSPEQVAKAPSPAPAAAPAKAPGATAKAAVATPSAGMLKLAQLTYPVPPTAAAGELLRAAEEYRSYGDSVHCQEYLDQLVSSYPGTKEAGRALALLADHLAAAGSAAQAEAAGAALANYADPEVQAFASLVRSYNAARRAKDFATSEQVLAAYAKQWGGSSTGGWAALRLGDVYRFSLLDPRQAITTFQGIIAGYPNSTIAEEAQVDLAETLNWSGLGTKEESQAVFEQVVKVTADPGLQVRALYGLGEVLSARKLAPQALEVLSYVIDNYPSHPGIVQAHAIRCAAALEVWERDLAVADARAFLAAPSENAYSLSRAHLVLAKDAYQRGDVAGAETEFRLLEEAAVGVAPTEGMHMYALEGLAACAAARGDLRQAMQLYLQAADAAHTPGFKAIDLSQAARMALRLNDSGARAQIIARMVEEVPGSHLTTQLVGHELLPVPEI